MSARSWSASVDDWLDVWKRAGRRRGWLVRDPSRGGVRASDSFLEPVAKAVEGDANYRDHEACFFEVGQILKENFQIQVR